ncbi:MAG: sigma-70 family RNA polymerase sigma factor [Bacilli bacterium]|nr:sigma-70 family RNA polymerase sigma factor [Bacilli bacterium]
MNYKSLNDYEMCYHVFENDEDAFEKVFLKYKPYILKVVKEYYKKYKHIGIDEEDLIQEGKIGLYRALKGYQDKDSLFYTYASICIERQIITYCRSYNTLRNYPLNYNIGEDHLYQVMERKDDYGKVEDILIENENFFEALNQLEFKYSIVFELRYNHFSNREIAELLDVPVSTIEGRVRRIRNVLSNNLNVSI